MILAGSLSNTSHHSELIGQTFIIPELQYIFAEFKQFHRKDNSWLMVWPGPGSALCVVTELMKIIIPGDSLLA